MSNNRKSSNDIAQVKNRAPAPIQISAEQILREAAERQQESTGLEPVVKIHDAEEYQSHLQSRRKQFEDTLRYRREHMGTWVKYARFEESNHEYERARSIFERALEVDGRSSELWLRYSEFELRNEFINHARNVLDRAIQLLPRVDFLWYKYVYVEEMIQDIPKCRAIYERWMKWAPDDNAWSSYAKFETRNGQTDRAEAVMRRYVNAYPCARSFLKFAKWAEYDIKNIDLARTIYEATLSELEPEESRQAKVFQQFASFEERQGEYERARVIYKHAVKLFNLGSGGDMQADEGVAAKQELLKRTELYKTYIAFEKKHGDKQGIEDALITRKRKEYNERLGSNPYDYDGWFEFIKMEQEQDHDSANKDSIRDVFERAVANVPPTSTVKDHWRRYIYLWIYYAVYEELCNQDIGRAAEVYETCLSIIPHSNFSFSKIWIYAAKLQIRSKNVTKARKLFGKAIGLCGKEKIFVEYIAMELALGEIDRCRKIYASYLQVMPHNCKAWCNYAALEQSVGETERCRAIYELAVSQSTLDMPELLWKNYIDFELSSGESEKARSLYQRLLQRTSHVKVWISYAQLEGNVLQDINRARSIMEEAYRLFKEQQLNEERILVLDAWRVLEQQHGSISTVEAVERKLPRRIKRKRMRPDNNTWEEYFDYQFPDDDTAATKFENLKILEMANKWKQQQQQSSDTDHSDGSSDVDD